jgi:stress-induced morphogen
MMESLESVLIENFNPDFLYLDKIDKDMINVVISSKCFMNQTIDNRVRSVYKVLEEKLPNIFDNYSVFVSTLTLHELEGSLDLILGESNEEN